MSGVDSGVVTPVTVRSYELDSFGHLNHAVYLSHFEYARFEALKAWGFPADVIAERGEAFHVVRVEVDYQAELHMGQRYEIWTRGDSIRRTSLTFAQTSRDPENPERVFAEARIVIVWIGPDRRPIRVPEDVRHALGFAP